MPDKRYPHSRIVVIGSSCAGKSTFASALACRNKVPFIELDELFWGPHWTPKPTAEFLSLLTAACATPRWVAAGNYGIARGLLWQQATTIVWLNYGLPVVLWRGLRRTLLRVVGQQPLFHDNRESFRRAFFSRDSILWWILSTYHRRQREFELLRASAKFGHLVWLEAQHPRQGAELLRRLQACEPLQAHP